MKTKKLFLASFTAHAVDHLIKFIGEKPRDVTVAFITTAADPYNDKWFVDLDRQTLINSGFIVEDFDIKNKSETELYNKLKKFKAIVVAGGNVYYLLEKTLESGFDKVLNRLLNEGVVYCGGSAGAVLVGPSLKPVESLDDPKLAPNLTSSNGLGIVNFVIIPHAGQEKYKDRLKNILDKFRDFEFRIIPLTNLQAIEVVGDNYKIVG